MHTIRNCTHKLAGVQVRNPGNWSNGWGPPQEKESLAQLARRHGVHPVVVGQWKKQLIERAAAAFDRGATKDVEQREAELLQKIGELTVERDFLSRGLPRSR